jgi:potassium-transporting ATPase KdpC subunit
MKNRTTALKMLLWMIIMTGVIYPFVITAIATLAMQDTASGSLLITEGVEKIVGSQFIAQKFTTNGYFWPRPSACDYDAVASGGSNLGPTSRRLRKAIDDRRVVIQAAHELAADDHIPHELLFASGSGLDPDISPETAYFQISRVIKARNLPAEEGEKMMRALIHQCTRTRRFGLLGHPTVNVLQLNMELDRKMSGLKNVQ